MCTRNRRAVTCMRVSWGERSGRACSHRLSDPQCPQGFLRNDVGSRLAKPCALEMRFPERMGEFVGIKAAHCSATCALEMCFAKRMGDGRGFDSGKGHKRGPIEVWLANDLAGLLLALGAGLLVADDQGMAGNGATSTAGPGRRQHSNTRDGGERQQHRCGTLEVGLGNYVTDP
jgi:hypothetical protein